MISQELQDRFIELRARGQSYDTIAKTLNLSKHTLIDLGRRYADTIEHLRTQHLETLAEQFQLLQQQQLQWLGQQLITLQEELSHRPLTDIPTHRIYDMILKIYRHATRQKLIPIPKEKTQDAQAPELPAEPTDQVPTTEPTPPAEPTKPPTDAPKPPTAPARTKTAPFTEKFNQILQGRSNPELAKFARQQTQVLAKGIMEQFMPDYKKQT